MTAPNPVQRRGVSLTESCAEEGAQPYRPEQPYSVPPPKVWPSLVAFLGRFVLLMCAAIMFVVIFFAAMKDARADEVCHYERKQLFVAPKPKASVVKPAYSVLVKPAAKPKRKTKVFDRLHSRDGFDWVCDTEPIETGGLTPSPVASLVPDVTPLAAEVPDVPAGPIAYVPLEPDAPVDTVEGGPLYAYAPPIVFLSVPTVVLAPVPEPSVWLLMLAGGLAIWLGIRVNRR